MKKVILTLSISLFAAVILWGFGLPAFGATGAESSQFAARATAASYPEQERRAEAQANYVSTRLSHLPATRSTIHDMIRDLNKADLGVFDKEPSLAEERQEYTRERAQGVRAYCEGKYDEALQHLATADSIIRSATE